MDQRLQFVTDHHRGLYGMSELCAHHGVSRKTGYKWLARYEAAGVRGLAERSHAPHACPHRIGEELAALLLDARRAHPRWGPVKLVQYLAPRHPRVATWPAVSTVADLLKRHALVRAHGLLSTKTLGVRPVFERAFREYGLPLAIRTDKGIPFANTGLHGLTQLNVWWLRLGIQHQRIRRASPQENGAHERMHRTLKAETTRPPALDLARQRRAFTVFRREYNDERPHAALGGDTPAARYTPSPRAYPPTLPGLEYPGHFVVKRVTHAGTIRFKYKLLFLAKALKDHHVGLEESDDGIWSLYLGRVLLGKIDERTMRVYD